MVIIFSSKKALRFLKQRGFVMTFRAHKRSKLGRDWLSDKRGGKKIGDVKIFTVGQYSSELATSLFIDMSGFGTPKEWNEEIRCLNCGKIPAKGWVYLVVDQTRKFRRY